MTRWPPWSGAGSSRHGRAARVARTARGRGALLSCALSRPRLRWSRPRSNPPITAYKLAASDGRHLGFNALIFQEKDRRALRQVRSAGDNDERRGFRCATSAFWATAVLRRGFGAAASAAAGGVRRDRAEHDHVRPWALRRVGTSWSIRDSMAATAKRVPTSTRTPRTRRGRKAPGLATRIAANPTVAVPKNTTNNTVPATDSSAQPWAPLAQRPGRRVGAGESGAPSACEVGWRS
jgi:hypothetical protein